MNSRFQATKRLKNTILRDRYDISPELSRSLGEEITSVIAEFFSVDENTARLTTQDSSGGKKIITYCVEIK